MYDSEFSKRTRFATAESDAQARDIGLWGYERPQTRTPVPDGGTTGGELVIEDVHADADGNDHENLNDEYVVFTNTGSEELEMGGWTGQDEAGHTYTVPNGFTLGSGESVTLYTGSGTDTDSELFWGSDSAVWNNGGDTLMSLMQPGRRELSGPMMGDWFPHKRGNRTPERLPGEEASGANL